MGSGKSVSVRLLVGVVLVVVFATVASAQMWTPFAVDRGGRYEFHVQKFDPWAWDENDQVQEYFYIVDIRETNETTEYGQPLYDVTISTRRRQTMEGLEGGYSFDVYLDGAMAFGNPFVYGAMLMVMRDMDFEVGERISLFGMGRVSVVEQRTVAGRTGLVVQFEEGEAGNRRLVLEWVIDRALPYPLLVREYDGDGNLTLETTLVKYEGY